jgi:hypothetical protein
LGDPAALPALKRKVRLWSREEEAVKQACREAIADIERKS